MARLIYTVITSLDGYASDEQGGLVWDTPDEEVVGFISALERPIGTYLYGRRMYETMVVWEGLPPDGQTPTMRDYATLWRAATKVVYSRTLREASSARTRIEREFHPEAVRRLKETAAHDISVGGAQLAGQAMRAGLVDEYRLFVTPVLVGGGQRTLPAKVRLGLKLLEGRTFGNGVAYLRYRPT